VAGPKAPASECIGLRQKSAPNQGNGLESVHNHQAIVPNKPKTYFFTAEEGPILLAKTV
jgi:hypothetical protein